MRSPKINPNTATVDLETKESMAEYVKDHVSQEEYIGTGKGLRLLIYSHDTFGLGHLQRCLKISRALETRYQDLAILIATGSSLVHRYQLPRGVDYVKLPAVRKIGPEQYEARILATSYQRIVGLRTSLLLGAVQKFEPHVLLVDHSPAGMKGEMLPALRWLRETESRCITVVGLRDILDDPDSVIANWRRVNIYDVLRDLYDHILVYGSQDVFDLVEAYQFSKKLRSKTIFCNYVSESLRRHNSVTREKQKRKLVAVSIGGGDGGGETVIGNYLAMVKQFKEKVNFDSVILTGPFLPPELAQQFREAARGLPVTLKPFVSSTTPYFRKSDLVISTAGYNSITQIMEVGRRALIIPRILHRYEQLVRAKRLAELGLVSFLHPDQVSPERLFQEIARLLTDHREPLTQARRNVSVRLDGAENTVRFFGTLFAGLDLSPENENGF